MQILLGKNKSGKTKYIFNKIDEDILNKKKCLLIVPSQMRLEIEKKYLEEQKKQGIMEFDITSFERLVNSYMASKTLNTSNVITKLDKSVIIRKLISKNEDIFKIYAKAKKTEGFWSSIDILVDLFRKEDITPQILENINLEDKYLECKIKEIAKIYKSYLTEVSEKYVDFAKEYDIYCNYLKESKVYKEFNIYIDGFNNFSKWEYDIIETLLNQDVNVIISLVTNVKSRLEASEKQKENMYSIANSTFIKLATICKSNGKDLNEKYFEEIVGLQSEEIKFLADNLYKNKKEKFEKYTENIKVSVTTNPYTELSMISKSIKENILKGYRYNDICIYTNEIEKYEFPIKKMFYEFEIPYYIDVPVAISGNNLVIYINSLLDILKNGYRQENIFAFLKTYLTKIKKEDIWYIENYILEFNITGLKWHEEFEKRGKEANSYEYDYKRLNNIRKEIVEIIEKFKKDVENKKTGKKIGEAIYNNLVENDILKNYEKYIDELKEQNLIDEASRHSQVANKLFEVFDSLAKIYEDENISYLKYKESFNFCINEIKISSMPNLLDKVIICDIGKSRVDNKKIVYIIGVNEGKLPRNISEDIMFNDDELQDIEAIGLKFRQNSKSKLYMQMYNITLAIKSAKNKIYFSFPSSELNGMTLRQSSIINIIRNIFPKIKIEGNVTKEDDNKILENIYSIKNMTNNFLEVAGKYDKLEDKEKIDRKYNENAFTYFQYNKRHKDNEIKEVLGYLRRDNNLSEESIKILYGRNLNTTISRLEQYKKCAFSYFVKYGLKAKERKIYKLSSMDIGSFIHEIIEKYSKYLMEHNITWQETLIENKYLDITDKVVEEVLKTKAYLFSNSNKNILLKEKLLKSVKKVICIIAKSFNQSKFVPLGYEIEFKEGGVYAPIEIKIEENKTMYITGKIDRVDIAKVNNEIYTRVIDYKSSTKTLSLDDIREGLSLQLITYMNAIINSENDKQNEAKSIPAGLLYFTFLNDVKHLTSYEKDINKIENKIKEAFRLKGLFLKDTNILEIMDSNINNDEKLIDASSQMRGNKYIEKEQFEKECENISNILSAIGKDVIKGKVKIYPNHKCKKTPCDYCEYIGICRKNIMI